MKRILFSLSALLLAAILFSQPLLAQTQNPLDSQAHPLYHVRSDRNNGRGVVFTALTPVQIKDAYNIPGTTANGTIAIIDAYADNDIAPDLNTFDITYNLPVCTQNDGCLTVHPMTNRMQQDSGWGLEESLDVQWAHAVSPHAKILLVQAKSANLGDLLTAVDYARRQLGVVAVSMSWGANEFSTESLYDTYFTPLNGKAITFFASSGDGGNGVYWPAASGNVVGVGGTTLTMSGNTFISETAWDGSGGGVSEYETAPSYQNISSADGHRAVPDVSFDADPNTGVAVYDTFGYNGWLTVGGTSVGSPGQALKQWIRHFQVLAFMQIQVISEIF